MERMECLVSSQDSRDGIATGYGMEGRDSIPGRENDFSLLYSVQTGSVAHTASYLMGTGGYFLRG
jgi:hypothetical protein